VRLDVSLAEVHAKPNPVRYPLNPEHNPLRYPLNPRPVTLRCSLNSGPNDIIDLINISSCTKVYSVIYDSGSVPSNSHLLSS